MEPQACKNRCVDQPVLSIAIPTYNRPQAMERLLKSLLPQLTPETEVIIRDDSPNEETTAIVRRVLEPRKDQVNYTHGPKLGIDAGTLDVVERSRGRYVWTFGDDDAMVPGAVQKVLQLIKEQPELTFIWPNIRVMGGLETGPSLSLVSDRRFESGDETIMALTNRMTLLSTFIFRRTEAMRGIELARRHDRSMWSIMLLVYNAVLAGPTYVLAEPLVVNHLEPHGEAEVLGGVQVFGINFAEALLEFRGQFSGHAIRRVLGESFGYVWRGFLVNRVRYPVRIPWSMIKELGSIYYSYPGFWVLAVLNFSPRPVLQGAYTVYHFFWSHRRFKFHV